MTDLVAKASIQFDNRQGDQAIEATAEKVEKLRETVERPAQGDGVTGGIGKSAKDAQAALEDSRAAITRNAQAEQAAQAQVQAAIKATTALRNADHARALAEEPQRAAGAAAVKQQAAVSAARKTLGFRDKGEVTGEIAKTQAAYEILKTSGVASEKELASAHAVMTAKVKDLNAELAGSMGHATGMTHGMRRELIVSGHEVVTGNFSRLPGTLMVLAERANISGAALLGIAAPVVIAAGSIALLVKAAEDGAASLHAMNHAIAASGGIAGLTRQQMSDAAGDVSRATTLTIAESKELVTSLVASGKIGATALAPIAQIADDLAATLGLDAEKLGPEMLKVFSDPAKGALELNERMHNLAVTDQERILTLQRMGDLDGARVLLVEKEKAAVEGQAKQYTALGEAILWAKKAKSEFWDHLGEADKPETAADKRRAAIKDLADFERYHMNDGKQRVASELPRLMAAVDATGAAVRQEEDAATKKGEDAEKNRRQSAAAVTVRQSRTYRAKEQQEQIDQFSKQGTGDQALDAMKGDRVNEMALDLQRTLPNTATAWQGFVSKFVVGAKDMGLSTSQAREQLAALLHAAVTPEAWTGLINGMKDVLGGENGAHFQEGMKSAIQGREAAQLKALDGWISGLKESGKRAETLFASVASQARLALGGAQGIARVEAELAKDRGALSIIDAAGARAEVASARAATDLKLSILDDEKRAKLALAQEEATGAADLAQRKESIERESAVTRRGILEDFQKTAESQAREALQRYKGYAEEVISADKEIARNRLDTAASIHDLLREGMDPKAQAQDLRDQMAENQAAAQAALQGGDKQEALSMLNRNRGLASSLAHVKGDGIDPAKQKEEAVQDLRDIGAQAEGIMQAQRAEAARAANEQKAVYQSMTQAIQQVGQEIAKLNTAEAMRLRLEVSQEAMQSAIQQIRDGLARETFKINVSALGATSALPTAVSPVAMAAAGQAPARAAVAAADQVATAATPSPAGRAAAQVPDMTPSVVAAKYRTGPNSFGNQGVVSTPSPVERAAAQIPDMTPAAAAAKYRTGPNSFGNWDQGDTHEANIHWPTGGRSKVRGSSSEIAALSRHINDTADMVGN